MTPKAFFIGDHPGLDFANTIAAPQDEEIEFIANGAALLAWLVDAKLIEEGEARLLLTRFGPEQMDLMAARARLLRGLVRTTLREIKEQAAAAATLATLVQELQALFAQDARYATIELLDGRVLLGKRRNWERPEQVLAVLADVIASLFDRADFELVRKCANPSCMLWFEDHTKAHRRLYCSPAACGNRAKVAAFRQRKKIDSATV